jgi:hypothetical protein
VSVPYPNTISGLVKKRAELCGESQILRGKLAAAQNAIESIDRVLETLGYDAPSDGRPPRGTRIIFFDRNELRRFLMDELREAKAPLSSREIAGKIIVFDGKDPSTRSFWVTWLTASGRVSGSSDGKGSRGEGLIDSGLCVGRWCDNPAIQPPEGAKPIAGSGWTVYQTLRV